MALFKDKLSKLKMPAKEEKKKLVPSEQEEMYMEEGEEDSPELAAAEEELGQDLDQDMEEGESESHKAAVLGSDQLRDVPDEELLAELKKRGLMAQMGGEEEEEEEDAVKYMD